MDVKQRVMKNWLKTLPPNQVLELLDEHNIPTPLREIIIVCCIENLDSFSAVDRLSEHYKVHISIWQYNRRLKDALSKLRKSLDYAENK